MSPLTDAQAGAFVKEFIMNKSQQKRFDELYRKHLRVLTFQDMSDKTIDAYLVRYDGFRPG